MNGLIILPVVFFIMAAVSITFYFLFRKKQKFAWIYLVSGIVMLILFGFMMGFLFFILSMGKGLSML